MTNSAVPMAKAQSVSARTGTRPRAPGVSTGGATFCSKAQPMYSMM